MTVDPTRVRGLLFDVQGTLTDFHHTVGAATADIVGDLGVDRFAFVNRWRAEYFRRTATGSGGRPDGWIPVDSLYRDALDDVLAEFGLDELGSEQRDALTAAWQALAPWPDVPAGLARLRSRFTIAALSNADVAAVVRISRGGGLGWDAVFTAEMFGAFKPDPDVYRTAARYLGFPSDEIMMVASHAYDVRAARELGFRTAFVSRPDEYGPDVAADTAEPDEYDLVVGGIDELADALGV